MSTAGRRPKREAKPGGAGASKLRLRMASRRNAIAPTVERILAAIEPAGLALEQRENLAVALAEALSNAAVHGNRLRANSRVSVTVEVEPGHVSIEIRDSGSGFDRGALPDPSEPEHLLDTHGRGVFLMGRLVDEIHYNQKGNRVRLSIRRHPHAHFPGRT